MKRLIIYIATIPKSFFIYFGISFWVFIYRYASNCDYVIQNFILFQTFNLFYHFQIAPLRSIFKLNQFFSKIKKVEQPRYAPSKEQINKCGKSV